ncbi:adenylyl cyclase CyaB, putative [Halovivax ruber XH-70]|uniref:Adenylyl cyclase CyaB, putative n=1 Tax=Halovivax ruber (strain DSM 18193 / JCM 13892 / XH-70) TaxID=797302 RepID=L0IDH8_HALRX|nr:class IV adenylate cyclase [Halovivax ruber]AGB16027.1 adenylyl cyclase CyaB, putative [Halovivax ruber XH-70]
MYEVEVKVPADHERVRERLERVEATLRRSVTQVDVYYDAPHRTFAETDEALRIRRERDGDDEQVKVTYKGPLVDEDSKTREEFETSVGDESAIEGILDRLGFTEAATVRKDRRMYALDGYTVTLDDVEGVGQYVEVEQATTEEDVDAVRRGAFEVVERLDLDPDEQIRTSYLGLLLDASSDSA